VNRWPDVAVRRVTRLGSGHTPSRQHPEYWENCTIPWLTLADVGQLRDLNAVGSHETKEMISELGVANSAAEVHPAGTVALSRTASVGFSCVLGRDMATSQDFATWTCGPRILPKYLLYAVRGQPDQIERRKMGSTHQTIYMPDIETLRVPLPPLDLQKHIVQYLDIETARIEALISKKRRMIDLLRARFEAWREAVMVLDADVSWTPLHRLTDPRRPVVYGIVQAGEEVADGVPYIKTGDVADLRPETLSRTSPEIEEAYRRARVHPGDIVVAMRASIGLPVMVPPELPVANLTQGTARVAPRHGIQGRWLIQALRCRAVQEQCRIRAVGTTFKTLNIWDLRRISVPTPSPERRAALAELVEDSSNRLDRTVTLLSRQVDLLIEHRQALITAAVTGYLEVPGAAA